MEGILNMINFEKYLLEVPFIGLRIMKTKKCL